MAHEATLYIETSPAIPFTVADAVGIEKGRTLKLVDPMAVSGSNAAADVVGGIAASEKIASDGKVKLGVYRGGVFKVYLSGACTAGDPAVLDAATNYFKTASLVALSGSVVAGTFFEDGTNGQTVFMELNPYTPSSAL